jgi:hypothetical protein
MAKTRVRSKDKSKSKTRTRSKSSDKNNKKMKVKNKITFNTMSADELVNNKINIKSAYDIEMERLKNLISGSTKKNRQINEFIPDVKNFFE